MKKIIPVILAFALMSGLTLAHDALAQRKFPLKPVTLYVGFSAGGITDTIARALTVEGESLWGKKFLVINKPGAGGAIAASLVAKSKPDGYTLQITPDTPITRAPHLRKLAFEPMKDFTFISRIGVFKSGFVVMEESPFKTWKDVVKWAKEHPGELKYGAPGTGTTPDIVMAVIAKREGFLYRRAPFKGDTPNMAALLGRHTMIAGSSTGAWSKYVLAKKMRLLLVLEEEGVDEFPDAPTLKEIGYDIETPTSVIIFGPKGIPERVAAKLGDMFVEAAKSKTFKSIAKSLELMATDQILTGRELDKYLRRNYSLYKKYIEEAGLAQK